MDVQTDGAAGFRGELRTIFRRAGEVWALVPARQRWALGGAAGVMTLASVCQVAIPLALGRLIDHVQGGAACGLPPPDLYRLAALDLGLLAAAYLLRECLNVFRRYLIEGTCLGIEKETGVRLVSHLLKMDLATLTHERVGALHGRIHRSVGGFVRFLRLTFLDFFPAVLTGVLALAATTSKQPGLGLVMTGVIPTALCLTVWQLRSQQGVRLGLMRSKENLDGTVVEQLGGMDYVRAADTHGREVGRVARTAEEHRAKELRHHFQMSLFGSGKALNEAFFHIVVLAGAVYFAANGSISFGDIWTFSLLFLSVMSPLSEVHRVLDEAHESSLQVGQAAGDVGRAGRSIVRRRPRRRASPERGRAGLRGREPSRRICDGGRRTQAGPARRDPVGAARRDAGDCRPLRRRQDHLAARAVAADAPMRRQRLAGRRSAGIGVARGHRPPGGLRRPGAVRLRRYRGGEHRLWQRRDVAGAGRRGRAHGLSTRRHPGHARRLRGAGGGARSEPFGRAEAANSACAGLPERPTDPHSGRGHVGPGRHQRTEGATGRRGGSQRPHGDPGGAPTVHAAARRPRGRVRGR